MKKGFSLIEAVIYITILSIILAISSVNIKKINQYKDRKELEFTANILLKDLKYAKEQAETSNGIYVIFNDNGYKMCTNLGGKIQWLKKFEFQDGICIDRIKSTFPNNSKIVFTNVGTVSPYGCSITIKDNKNNSVTISIKPIIFSIDFKKEN